MKHWWADTLFKRLFLLMWFGLVASHLLAFSVTTRVVGPPPHAAGAPAPSGLPVLPSLPPGGLPGDGGPPHRDRADERPHGLPAGALWLDYGIRFLAIGVVAWFGARWLSAPMRRLAEAAEALGRDIGRGRPGPPLATRHGTLEVRQAAQVFNNMAQRLHTQFGAQALLMAAISHDLRTPLARLRLRLETLASVPAAERCIDDVREMDALIASVLGMMREQHASEAPQRVDVAALAQSLVDDLAEQSRPACTTAPPEGNAVPALALAQPAALNRVLGNLIGNALRHGGNARVTVARHGAEVRVTVDDDGPGIPPDALEAVFEPFHRLDPARRSAGTEGGSGLGLYIARDLARRHGGRLTLANRAGGGLRAELVLPAA